MKSWNGCHQQFPASYTNSHIIRGDAHDHRTTSENGVGELPRVLAIIRLFRLLNKLVKRRSTRMFARIVEAISGSMSSLTSVTVNYSHMIFYKLIAHLRSWTYNSHQIYSNSISDCESSDAR